VDWFREEYIEGRLVWGIVDRHKSVVLVAVVAHVVVVVLVCWWCSLLVWF